MTLADVDTTVETTRGAVRGTRENGISVFRGIPYAQPPVGKLRFRPPVPPDRWDGVRDATRFGEIVPQTDESPIDKALLPDVPQGDDCLSLNVWTPDLGAASLPVMVWLHGGSFKWGSGSCPMYDGATFAREGVVTVSINYRLFAAGFLYVDDRPGSGNFGLLDQIAALEWVQENIASFGGDPRRVTLAGQSAGAHSIGELLAAPAARGLFHRGILQSGAAQMHMSAEVAEVIGAEVVSRLRASLGDDALMEVSTAELIDVTRAVEAEILPLLAKRDVVPGPMTLMSGLATLPVHGTDVLPEPALDSIARGAARDVDLLVGSNAEEWAAMVPSPEAVKIALTQTEMVADVVFDSEGLTGEEVLDAYRRGEDASDVVVPFGTDLVFRIPAIRLATAAQQNNPRTYMYRFAWKGALGAAHALDLPFMFDTLDEARGEVGEFLFELADERPESLATIMHGTWSNFVKTGSPHHPDLPDWPAYEPTRRATMELDVESRIVDDPDADTRRLWDGVQY